MRLKPSLFIFMSLLTGSLMAKIDTPVTAPSSNQVQMYGYVEKITLVDKDLILSAKLDTGAKSASLNATGITEVDVNGVPYLRFTVPTKAGDYVFQCPYIGKVKIKVRANEANPSLLKSTPIRRPVILLRLKLGDKVRDVHVNLTSRKRFLYPLLLGRDAIIDFNGAVNPALTFTERSKSLTSQ